MINKEDVPNRGDVVFFDFDPISGHEQSGTRPALVLTGSELSSFTNMITVCPITSRVRGNYFEVKIETKETKGVALINHVRSIDFVSRSVKIIGHVDSKVVKEAVEKVRVLIEG